MKYPESIISHYVSVWGAQPKVIHWMQGPYYELPKAFKILEFQLPGKDSWIYATCCMSQPKDRVPLELHLYSPCQYEGHAELLTALAHYHRTGRNLDLGHSVNFGRPWIEGSRCDRGLVSLPYLDGPALETLTIASEVVKFYWLIPITKEEVEFKKKFGLDAIEKVFEEKSINYLDPGRKSSV